MDYINDKLRISACVLLFFIMTVGWGQGAKAAGDPATLFQDASRDYVDLVRDAAKKKVRENWLKLINEYLSIAEKFPESDLAPESCARAARVCEHFSRYSGRKSDLKTSSQIYQDLARRYPKSAIADDALYNAGLLEEKLGNNEKAASLYHRILDEYAQGDMTDKAGEKLYIKPSAEKPAKKAPVEKPAQTALMEKPLEKAVQKATRGKAVEKPADKPQDGEVEVKNAETPSRVKKISHTTNEGSTRVIVELDGGATYKAFVAPEDKTLNKPVRLVIDLKGARTPKDVPTREDVDEGIVSSIRTSRHPDNTVRIVLDLKEKPSYQISRTEDPSQIIIDVGGSKAFTRQTASAQSDARDGTAPPYQKQTVKKVPKGTHSQMRKDLPSIASQLCLKVSKIVVDPGHGGKDPGAISASGVKEKDLTLEIGKLLAKRLKADGFEVYLTRTRDEFVALEERTTFANKKRADLFVSLHVNSHQNLAVSGIETYFLNLTTDTSAIEVAARENTYSDKSISDLQLILNDLMLNSKINESSRFANCVHTSVLSSATTTGYDTKNLGVRQAPFYVLLGAQMPSILIELGFLTNSTDISLLKKHSYQETLVDGVAKGINSYIMNTTYAYSWRNK
jgi:N-acetylmuramoyl-L-alanine amidase